MIFCFCSFFVWTNAHIKNTTSSHDDDRRFGMSQVRYHRTIWEKQLLWSWRFLVCTLRQCLQHKTSAHVVRGLTCLQSTDTVQDSRQSAERRCPTKRTHHGGQTVCALVSQHLSIHSRTYCNAKHCVNQDVNTNKNYPVIKYINYHRSRMRETDDNRVSSQPFDPLVVLSLVWTQNIDEFRIISRIYCAFECFYSINPFNISLRVNIYIILVYDIPVNQN